MIEHSILGNLIEDEEYSRAIIPFLKPSYFSGTELKIYELIDSFITKYNARPTKEALKISIDSLEDLDEKEFVSLNRLIDDLEIDPNTNRQFLIEETEKFAKEKSLLNALREAISIFDNKEKKNVNQIPQLLQDALSVSFDPSVGTEYFENVEQRYEEYHKPKNKLPIGLEYFDKIWDGGLVPKSMAIIIAPTGIGKSLFMCDFAAKHLMMGKNVMYFSMEMSEHQLEQRIEHNLLNVTKNELMDMSKETLIRRVARVKEKTLGRLIIKEFPSGGASVAHFKHCIQEARIKKNFVPDVIYVDYLNICASVRMKMGGSVNSYILIKAVAEELRGIAQEYGIPLITATQTNRDGMNSSDIDMTNTSESIGITHTCDYMVALISSEEMEQLGQIMVKQLKNRYGDKNYYNKFVVGIDRPRMKLYDVELSAQEELITDDRPVMEQTDFGTEDRERKRSKPRRGFGDFK